MSLKESVPGPPLGELEAESYVPTDSVFGTPWLDLDEWRELPYPHRQVHGGFAGTDTRFTVYFPPEAEWQGRLYAPVEGGLGGHDNAFSGPMGEMMGGLAMTGRLGGYMLDTNQGHIGSDVDAVFGDDSTIYGFRATNEAARFSKHLAKQVYGREPEYSYVFGGSGGARRSPGCLEWGRDVWSGALPFMGGGNVVEHGDTSELYRSTILSWAEMLNVQRLLLKQLPDVVDAMAPGGSGDPYVGLDTHRREELATLYRLGYPRGDEFMIGYQTLPAIWLWATMADDLQAKEPDYFEAFWSRPGYVGHDSPQAVADDLIDVEATVKRVISARDLAELPDFAGPEWQYFRTMASMLSSGDPDLLLAVELEGVDGGYPIGAGVRVTTGDAAGRQLYAVQVLDGIFQCDGWADANILRFAGVKAGDRVQVENRAFLAYCYYYRHHLMDDPQFDCLRVDGVPAYPQHQLLGAPVLMGVPYSGDYTGKLLWVHHSHDALLWPVNALSYVDAVRRSQGEEGLQERFCLQWTENAEHTPAFILPSGPTRATSTWLIDYRPVIEQGLVDLARWCEDGVKPGETAFSFSDDWDLQLPATAAERGGIQPVVHLTVDGGVRTDVTAGTSVTLSVVAEVPPGMGTITSLEWDFEGFGAFPDQETLDGTQTRVELSKTHQYDTAGTFFAAVRVTSNREGDVSTTVRQIPNVASARVVVSAS